MNQKIACCLFVAIIITTAFCDSPMSSVVKLLVTKRQPDFTRPWTKAAPEKASGSGVVIDGKRILTNAHVVMHASEVFVQLRRGGDQLPAKVKAIAPGVDLALVELTNPDKLKDISPLAFAKELPQLKSRVSVYGYPKGGDDLSVTDGIVSRIEFTNYNFSALGVRVQVDAALNPGNSGGPAIDNGKIVGLVFSKIVEAENIGYLIPPEEISAFLSQMKDGKYAGNMLLFDEFQTAENEAIRAFLKIPEDVTGVVVTEPYRDEKDYPLKRWDVVTHVGPHAIDNQGYVDVREGLRMRFTYYVARLAADGRIPLTVLPNGKKEELSVPVSPRRDFLLPVLEDGYPEYFIYGPLVFSAASQEYVRAIAANSIGGLLLTESPLISRLYQKPSEPGEQVVVVATRMFPHRIIKGYENRPYGAVAKLNGKHVNNLRSLAELLRDNKDEFLRFEMADRNESLVFRRSELEAATEEILSTEGIRYQASESLRDVFEAKK
jgi:S1-C subfamily serine protease